MLHAPSISTILNTGSKFFGFLFVADNKLRCEHWYIMYHWCESADHFITRSSKAIITRNILMISCQLSMFLWHSDSNLIMLRYVMLASNQQDVNLVSSSTRVVDRRIEMPPTRKQNKPLIILTLIDIWLVKHGPNLAILLQVIQRNNLQLYCRYLLCHYWHHKKWQS